MEENNQPTSTGAPNPAAPEVPNNPTVIDGAQNQAVVNVLDPPKQNKFKQGGKSLMAAILVVLVLLAGGAFAYYLSQVNKPENIVKQALADSYEQNSAKFDASFTDPESSAQVVVSGAYDQASLAIEGQFSYFEEANNLGGKLNLKFIDQSLYLQLDSLSENTVLSLGFFASILQQIEGQWILLESSDLEEYGSLVDAEAPNQQDLQLSDDDIDEISDIIKETDFFTATEVSGLDGADQSAKGYEIVFQKEGLIELLEKLKDSQVKLFTENREMLDEAITDLQQTEQSEIEEANIQVFIADGLVSTVIISDVDNQTDNGSLTLNLFDYGQAIDIAAPSDALSIDQIFADLFGQPLETLEP